MKLCKIGIHDHQTYFDPKENNHYEKCSRCGKYKYQTIAQMVIKLFEIIFGD